MSKSFKMAVLAMLSAAVLGGCYDYPKPPASLLGESYTAREQDAAGKLLDGITTLTLADAQRIALLNNPDYISASRSIEAARFRYYQAIGAYSPTVSASFRLSNTHTWHSNEVNIARPYDGHGRQDAFSTSTAISANWMLFDGLAREFSVLAANHSVKASEALESDACRLLMQSVATAYNTVLSAIENKRISEENQKFQEIMLEDARNKHEAGAVPLSNVLNFEILANNAAVDRIVADHQYNVAVYALAALMGYSQGTLPEDIDFPLDFKGLYETLPSVEIYLDAALANRPDLRQYRERLEISKYQLYQTISSYSPTLSAFANLGFDTALTRFGSDNQRGYNHTYINTPSLSYGIQAEWLIFNGFTRYNQVREYQANVAVAEYAVAKYWLAVVSEVRTAYTNYVQSVQTTKILERTRELSSRQRDLVEEEYRAGNAEVTRLNEAQLDLVTAETNLASSRINILNAKAKLEAVVGVNTADYYLSSRPQSGNAPGLEAAANTADNAAVAVESAQPTADPAAAPEAAAEKPAEAKVTEAAAAPASTEAPAISADPNAPPPAAK